MRLIALLSASLLLLAACGGSEQSKYGAAESAQDFASPMSPPPPPAPVVSQQSRMAGNIVDQDGGGGGGGPTEPVDPAAARLMAYTYDYRFAVPTANMQGLLSAHEAACQNAGPAVCYVVNSSISGLGEDYASGHLIVKASPEWVKTFQAGMADGLRSFNATLDSNTTAAEDLTVQIIDTTARLDSAKTLRGRLQQLLAERPGRLSDLLEIERELARVQAEIDSTESILAAMKLRVAMSNVTLSYTPKYSAVSQSIWRPLADAFDNFLPNVVGSLAAIIAFISGAALWLVLIGLVVWAVVWRMRARRRKTAAAKATAGVPKA